MSTVSADLQDLYDRREDLLAMVSDNDDAISVQEDTDAMDEGGDDHDEHKVADDRERAADMNAVLIGGWR